MQIASTCYWVGQEVRSAVIADHRESGQQLIPGNECARQIVFGDTFARGRA